MMVRDETAKTEYLVRRLNPGFEFHVSGLKFPVSAERETWTLKLGTQVGRTSDQYGCSGVSAVAAEAFMKNVD